MDESVVCVAAAWQRAHVIMLTLAMRREREDSSDDFPGAVARQRSRDSDEFVDILQVQQLLLEAGRPPLLDAPLTQLGPPSSIGQHHLQHHGVNQPPPPPPFYYSGQHAAAPCASVEDLVAMWFAGSSATGVCSCIISHSHVCVSEFGCAEPPSRHVCLVTDTCATCRYLYYQCTLSFVFIHE